MKEALEDLNHNKQNLQIENIELNMLLHEEKEEEQSLLQQLQAKDEALEKLQRDPCEVKSNSPSSCMFSNDDFAIFENHTTRIGSKLLNEMDYEGKGLGINRQVILNPIKVKELPHQVGLGYVKKEVGECDMTTSEPPAKDDEKPSLVFSKLIEEVKDVNFISVSYSHGMISVRDVEIPITGTNMRILTRMRYKEEK